jgi:hypothetical protein
MSLPTGTTGQGTTVTLTTGGSVACVRSITLPTWSMESIDASCLSDVGFSKKIAGDLTDAGTVQVTSVLPLGSGMTAPSGDQDTITITLPGSGTDGAGGAALTGTGFISEVTGPNVEIGGLLEQTITFTFDGMTGPTFSA